MTARETIHDNDHGGGMETDFGKDYWEDRYRGNDAHAHRPAPSPHLVAEVQGVAAGRALEAGCGRGGNAVWLAEQGWRVTAVDLSATALAQAEEYAGSRGAEVADRIEWVEADLTVAPAAAAAYDLVTAHYVHPTGPFADFLVSLAASVRPGGHLLVVGHGPEDEHSHARAPGDVALTGPELAAELDPDDWEIDVAETRSRVEPTRGIAMHDAVLRARRS